MTDCGCYCLQYDIEHWFLTLVMFLTQGCQGIVAAVCTCQRLGKIAVLLQKVAMIMFSFN